ncbi:alpha/beta fold hydrolase [Marinobacterium sediminicola]|uniref:Pimeloyl-ACP methyl ester carboxylesterase n=1 Tax=Marinobacterium sediminicola TaxID=518898 RepID=A0ABY1RX80_9GAMM|nr:alpha/beta hydrolase [Marinobacterium sediminicola]ULG67829.1 alpha/beta hydrolase [Marinobacterium sediminicola]SMR71491.1 Pimeloyl-ACP methyl ester carboxylesterase [Marinobacterium sediminicola]
MKHPFDIEESTLLLPDQQLHYRLYRNRQVSSSRRLLLIHGAGVAGEDTWHMLIAFLTQWSEVLVPDLRGAGNSHYPDRQEHGFDVHALVNDMSALVDHLGWWQFDLGGYSLGGLVSMLLKQRQRDRIGKQYLLESAVLDRPDWDSTVELRRRYSEAAVHLRSEDRDQGIRQFLDTISPNRKVSAQTESVAVSRLARRPLGFAHSLDAVTAAINTIDREELLSAQGDVSSFIGGQSVELMHQLHLSLAERMANWHYFMVPGTDHSLPFQKPRQIARIMNEELERYLESV